MTSSDQKTFPPVGYVPCEQSGSGDEDLRIDLRRTGDGRSALLVYSALDRLVSCCGEYQPWDAGGAVAGGAKKAWDSVF